jgi:hypothetical protein
LRLTQTFDGAAIQSALPDSISPMQVFPSFVYGLSFFLAKFSNFTCVECGFKTCNECRNAAHIGVTCGASGHISVFDEVHVQWIDPTAEDFLDQSSHSGYYSSAPIGTPHFKLE